MQIAHILGESSEETFLHRRSAGEFFITMKDTGPPSFPPHRWLANKRRKSLDFIRALQYFKNGVVHATYTIPHYRPNWVNNLWKEGIFFLGTPRFCPYKDGEGKFNLEDSEMRDVEEWVKVYFSKAVQRKLKNRQSGFQQMLTRAGRYYESSLMRETNPERLIDLAIALESMLTSASTKSELTFRLAQSLAHLLGTSSGDRFEIFKAAKKLYDRRSQLLHGQYNVEDYANGRYVSDEEISCWAALIRRALVRLAVLYMRGTDNREEFLLKLSQAALDSAVGENLLLNSDPDRYLVQLRENSLD